MQKKVGRKGPGRSREYVEKQKEGETGGGREGEKEKEEG